MNPVRLALLGATSHISKGLIDRWSELKDRELFLYARSPERVLAFLTQLKPCSAKIFSINSFGDEIYDVIINCVGMGSPQKLKKNMSNIFQITTIFDNLILEYLAKHPQTLYVNLSSAAAYGTNFAKPVNDESQARFSLNTLKQEEFYGIAKLHGEARHRALPKFNIIDIRIFGYFSKYIDLKDKFLLSEVISCIQNNTILKTSPINIWRDFLTPQDLALFIDCCISNCPLNAVFDVCSAKAISKFELLDFFANTYGLRYKIDKSYQSMVVTGQKLHYYSTSQKSRLIGYQPSLTSIEGIKKEMMGIAC